MHHPVVVGEVGEQVVFHVDASGRLRRSLCQNNKAKTPGLQQLGILRAMLYLFKFLSA